MKHSNLECQISDLAQSRLSDRQAQLSILIDRLSEQGQSIINCPPPYTLLSHQVPPTRSGGGGTIDLLRHAAGTTIQWRYWPKKMADHTFIPFLDVTCGMAEPALVSHSICAGSIRVRDGHTGVETTINSGTTLFKSMHGADLRIEIGCDSPVSVTTCITGMTDLCSVIGSRHARYVLTSVDVDDDQKEMTIDSPFSDAPINNSPNSLVEEVAKLKMEARALECISLIMSRLTHTEPATSVSIRERQIEQIHAEMRKCTGKAPSLREISERYGISVKTLNSRFKKVYGNTISSYILDHRLNEAHRALQYTNIPTKVIAGQLGYSHVNNFISAFKKKFGYPPGSLRR